MRGSALRKYAANSSWMIAEQVLRIISGVFVGIYIARYLGPESFGTLSYAIAIAAFAIAFTKLGMDSILVRELVKEPSQAQRLIGTAFWLITLASILSYAVVTLIILSTEEVNTIAIYTLIATSSAFFISLLCVDYYFQAIIKAKYSTACKVITLAITACIKTWLVIINADLQWFIIASVLDHALLGLLLIITLKTTTELDVTRGYDNSLARDLIKSSWPMAISAVGLVILGRIDQVMIRNILGLNEVGMYSSAIRVYEAWIVLPYILSISLLPAIVTLKKGEKSEYILRLTQLFRGIIWLNVAAAVCSVILGEKMIAFTFGEEYKQASSAFIIVMWGAVFASMGSLSARYFNVERMEKKILLRTLVAATLNVLFNLWAIPRLGINGAAYATLASLFFANYVMDWLDRDLKELLHIKNMALAPFNIKRI